MVTVLTVWKPCLPGRGGPLVFRLAGWSKMAAMINTQAHTRKVLAILGRLLGQERTISAHRGDIEGTGPAVGEPGGRGTSYA